MSTVSKDHIEKSILVIRCQRVIVDVDLAIIYGVTTGHLNQQVKRNLDRFPSDFMFQLTEIEEESLRSQIETSKIGRGGRRYFPFVFTEHGALMLASNSELARKLDTLEKKYDYQFRVVFDAIRELTRIPEHPSKRIGIKQDD